METQLVERVDEPGEDTEIIVIRKDSARPASPTAEHDTRLGGARRLYVEEKARS